MYPWICGTDKASVASALLAAFVKHCTGFSRMAYAKASHHFKSFLTELKADEYVATISATELNAEFASLAMLARLKKMGKNICLLLLRHATRHRTFCD